MTTTIDTIPFDLRSRVISRKRRERINIPTIEEFYQAWADGLLSMPPRKSEPEPPALSYEEQVRQGEEWFAGMEALVEELRKIPVADPRTCREILNDDRNRLEKRVDGK